MNKLVKSNRNKNRNLDRGNTIKPSETFKLETNTLQNTQKIYTPKPASIKVDTEIRDKINALSIIGLGENQKEIIDRALTMLIESLVEEQQRTYKNQFNVLRQRSISKNQ
ncbi:DUF5388 domain-containing protein [Enterococcus faecalis]|uniref:DUF5388 domain-containing protein n=1 Tax=Enterococcus faecalis TaxID=1351 RepID=UPI001F59888E|nr:DUF5388 domain-containing protein [Enterococcus faecalis]